MNNNSPCLRRGLLFVVSGPSGVGKTVLCSKMIERFHRQAVYSISATSRLPRGAEKEGQEYFFYSREQFEEAIKKEMFAEWAMVHGNYYGTPKAFLEKKLSGGKHVILNIDVQGAMKIKRSYPNAIMIFILPPSMEILEERLRKRNMDSEDVLRHRMANAQAEIEARNQYEHVLINDDLDEAVRNLENIFNQYITSDS